MANVYLSAQSRRGYDRRYEDKSFPDGTRCIELVDYIGQGGEIDENGEMVDDGGPGNYLGVYYCAAESMYRIFANARFNGPCIVDIGEYPAEAYDESGEAITDTRINMAAAFRFSDLEILPHGCSRYLIDNMNNMFEGCDKLRTWTPQEMEAAGLANVTDPRAPRILRSNGIAESAFLYNLAPETIRYAFAGCSSYSGRAINAISWSRLKSEKSAEGFAEGCRFSPHFLDAIISWLHREAIVLKRVRTPLLNVDFGAGRVTGEVAKQASELIEYGIELTGFDIA
jgi:hypothetical protein